jgi:hypothetical protein
MLKARRAAVGFRVTELVAQMDTAAYILSVINWELSMENAS